MALNFGTPSESEALALRCRVPANNERSCRPDKNLVDFLCATRLSPRLLPHYVSDIDRVRRAAQLMPGDISLD